MKKRFKKVVVMVICFVMATAILSACNGNTGNTEDKPTSTTPTEKPTEVVTTEPTATEEPTVTEAPTTEPTTEPTTTVEQQTQDVIIPLFDAPYESEVRQVAPEQWNSNYEQTYACYFPLISTGNTVGDATIYQFADSNYAARETFTLSNGAGVTTEVAVYLCVRENGASTISFEANVSTDSIDFVPLFYNQTKQCLVGYSGYNTDNPGFREVYWDNVINITIPTDVDPALYGF
jgi:hypothetical protein